MREREPLWVKLLALGLLAIVVGIVCQLFWPEDRDQERMDRSSLAEMNENLEGTGLQAIYVDPDAGYARKWVKKTRKAMPSGTVDVEGKVKVDVKITFTGESKMPYYDTGEEVWSHCFHYEVEYEAPPPEGLELGTNATGYALQDFLCSYDMEHFGRKFARGPRFGEFSALGGEGDVRKGEFVVEYFDRSNPQKIDASEAPRREFIEGYPDGKIKYPK